ncbi:predicted protein [Histoplasma mississippiense (nom. inval.)]|uniref:predicted protein n=1 Tax=Ajellomyces capsulatus (strain NAm1 / WU24) TaxID=2059318 RepID=UPI000157BCFE|nr:predicted protein [Histoplasma mississippiense (nom. inval.)]EDN06258.1 predicted protein [Histoplasma mississippiense (nom. inval.)]
MTDKQSKPRKSAEELWKFRRFVGPSRQKKKGENSTLFNMNMDIREDRWQRRADGLNEALQNEN